MQMTCAWEHLLRILPLWLRQEVEKPGKENLQEIRLRLSRLPELVMKEGHRKCGRPVMWEDLNYCINAASGYSPWVAKTVSKGYLTAPGGHRIGLCGEGTDGKDGSFVLQKVTSLCIRVARDHPGLAQNAPRTGSVLILGAPGWGKTTLLRDLIRRRGEYGAVSVVDERGELFPEGFDRGAGTDVLTGVEKKKGFDMLLRTMGPGCIALDEITSPEDCGCLMQAAGCGVELLATAHAGSLSDFYSRPLYRDLVKAQIFHNCLVLDRNQNYKCERMELPCLG